MTPEELAGRRKMIEYTSFKTAGTFGRPPDLGPTIGVGLLARKPLFAGTTSAISGDNNFADNIDSYVEFSRENNLICAEVLSDPQADRSRASEDHPGLLRVTEVLADGVVVNGAKSVGSLSAQANEIIFTNFARPDAPPEAYIWAATPVNAEGIVLVCREGVSHPGADPFDHPLASRGEEADQLIIFNDVFLPNERIFNLGVPKLGILYGPVTVWGPLAHPHPPVGQGEDHRRRRPGHRRRARHGRDRRRPLDGRHPDRVRGGAEGVRHRRGEPGGAVGERHSRPDVNLLTAGRLYGIQQYPHIIHTLQELCGQGLVMRFPKAAFEHEMLGPRLAELLPGHDITAADKNRLMNFVWDLTSSSHAGRTELFENLNGGVAPFLRERLYKEWDRTEAVGMARDLAGLV